MRPPLLLAHLRLLGGAACFIQLVVTTAIPLTLWFLVRANRKHQRALTHHHAACMATLALGTRCMGVSMRLTRLHAPRAQVYSQDPRLRVLCFVAWGISGFAGVLVRSQSRARCGSPPLSPTPLTSLSLRHWYLSFSPQGLIAFATASTFLLSLHVAFALALGGALGAFETLWYFGVKDT
jgi:hypothetical protein